MDGSGRQTSDRPLEGQASPSPLEDKTGHQQVRLRIAYRKCGDLRFLSHLDLVRTLERALRRSGLPLAFSQGFNPRIRLSFPGALSTGIESDFEEFDVVLTSPVDTEAAAARLRELLPRGLDILGIRPSAGKFRMPSVIRYELILGTEEPLSDAIKNALRASVARSALGPVSWFDTSSQSMGVAVATGEGGGSALVRALVASMEATEPRFAPIRIRKLPSDPNETTLDWKPDGIEHTRQPLEEESTREDTELARGHLGPDERGWPTNAPGSEHQQPNTTIPGSGSRGAGTPAPTRRAGSERSA